ncbi:MAG: PQQ-binding-like beta-propeller repeat protein [Methanofollis sp.]|uniref:outer membrane protein assembly factor BamB family protein n=1 Tax=Methanofollis sp. TaxID=2052835 RepID=UPI002616A7C4|nr:PQQ-binding-like beta-propeller repeat protein [Methanofollis sp.]MDD4256049.1 PQQ-binding-like beta-propeller repeat protein [Methanofollis sp.]
MLLAAPVAADYPMFHADTARTGAALSAGPLTDTTLWVAETAEYADGSPAVHAGKVFVPTWADMNFTDNEPMGLVCYDAATGRELWTNELGGQAVGSVSGVAVADGQVYLGGTDGKLYCIDEETGATLWSSDQIDETGYFGLSSSPLVYDGKVYVLSASDGALHEFSLAGAETWSYAAGGKAAYFASATAADGKVYCSNMTALFCVDPALQKEVWNTSVRDVILSTPCLSDSTLFCTGALRTYAFDRDTGEELWNRSLQGTSSSPAFCSDKIYVGAKDGLHCLDAATGAERWAFRSAQVTVSPVIAGGIVYFGTNEEAGTLYAMNADDGEEVWSHTLESPGDGTFAAFYASSPAVSDGVLYIGAEDNHLYAFGEGAAEPEVIWDGTVALPNTTFAFVPSNNASASYAINRTTDLGALDAAATDGGFTFNASDAWYSPYSSFLLEDIDGIANEVWTQPNAKSWTIFVNDAPAKAGLGANDLAEGDELTFYYCPTDPATYAPLVDEAAYIITIGVTITETDSTLALTDGTRGGSVLAKVNVTASESGWYVVVVSGTNAGGDAIAGTGTVLLDAGETIHIPVIVAVPARANTGTYTLYAGIYLLDDYPAGLISRSGGSECTVA